MVVAVGDKRLRIIGVNHGLLGHPGSAYRAWLIHLLGGVERPITEWGLAPLFGIRGADAIPDSVTLRLTWPFYGLVQAVEALRDIAALALPGAARAGVDFHLSDPAIRRGACLELLPARLDVDLALRSWQRFGEWSCLSVRTCCVIRSLFMVGYAAERLRTGPEAERTLIVGDAHTLEVVALLQGEGVSRHPVYLRAVRIAKLPARRRVALMLAWKVFHYLALGLLVIALAELWRMAGDSLSTAGAPSERHAPAPRQDHDTSLADRAAMISAMLLRFTTRSLNAVAVTTALLLTGACSKSARQVDPNAAEPAPSDPTAAAALRRSAQAAYAAKDYPLCADQVTQAVKLAPESRNEAYDAACCLALAGRPDAAFEHLNASASNGYRDPAHLAEDADLVSLHADARWVAVAEKVQRNRGAYLASVNPELESIYAADQGDRRTPDAQKDWTSIGLRDTERRARVSAILEAGGARVSADYFHAAMVFQHGHDLIDYQRAHDLALKAVEMDATDATARWLAAASEDRLLMNEGKPQEYGTQFRTVDGRWELYEVDPSVTDAVRKEWNVPPLAEAQARVAKLNEKAP